VQDSADSGVAPLAPEASKYRMPSPARQQITKDRKVPRGEGTVVIPRSIAMAAAPPGSPAASTRRDSAEDLERAVLLDRRVNRSMSGLAPGREVRSGRGLSERRAVVPCACSMLQRQYAMLLCCFHRIPCNSPAGLVVLATGLLPHRPQLVLSQVCNWMVSLAALLGGATSCEGAGSGPAAAAVRC